MAWYGVSELSRRLRVADSTVRRWIGEGLPSAVGPSGSTIVNFSAATRWLEEQDLLEDDEEEELEDSDEEDELAANAPDDESEDGDECEPDCPACADEEEDDDEDE